MNTTSSETFPITPKVKPSDNIIKVCPDHLKTPDTIKEKNYFFKLSKYQTWLEEFYQHQPEFVIPSDRFNEVKAFVGRGLDDFSISRETNTFGIKLPFDNTQVTYVWFDALFNYYTACKYSRGADKDNTDFIDESDMWPADLHVVGKDIIRFHAIYWPAMLASYFGLGEEKNGVLHYKPSDKEKLPGNILTTGFLTVDGQKISKSLGNVIDPVEYSEKYSKDLLALYLFSAFNIGQDGDFDQKQSVLMYNAKLANNLGNLVNRVVVLSLKLDGVLNKPEGFIGKGEEVLDRFYDSYNLKAILDKNFQQLDILNKYVDETQPWNLIKEDQIKAQEVLFTLAEGLRQVGLSLYPFFPGKMSEMFEKLGLDGYTEALENGRLEDLLNKKETFHIKEKGENLFERIEIEK